MDIYMKLLYLTGGVAGGTGGQLPPSGLKTGVPKYGEGAKMTTEVCMVSQCKVSLECTA